MVSCQNVSYSIDNKILLKDINCLFQPGKINLLIGPNGAGKSTLIKLLCRQIKPAKGQIEFDDQSVDKFTTQDMAKIRAVLSQNIDLAFPMLVEDVVMMGRYPHFEGRPMKQDYQACNEAMVLFGVEEFAKRNYLNLSGGEKQRVQFARVLAQIWFPVEKQKRYLFLDEPLTFLDINYQYLFMTKIKELAQQSDIIVVGVLHDLNLVAQFGDEIFLLHQGNLIATGTAKTILTPKNIREVYGLKLQIHEFADGMFLRFGLPD